MFVILTLDNKNHLGEPQPYHTQPNQGKQKGRPMGADSTVFMPCLKEFTLKFVNKFQMTLTWINLFPTTTGNPLLSGRSVTLNRCSPSSTNDQMGNCF